MGCWDTQQKQMQNYSAGPSLTQAKRNIILTENEHMVRDFKLHQQMLYSKQSGILNKQECLIPKDITKKKIWKEV